MKNNTVTQIINTGHIGIQSRVLIADVTWVDGKPTTPPLIDDNILIWEPSWFTEAPEITDCWVDVSDMVTQHHYNADSGLHIGQLSLQIPTQWSKSDVFRYFREMTCIVVQEKYSSATVSSELVEDELVYSSTPLVTDWLYKAVTISDGCSESWEGGVHQYVVNAKGVLKYANLDALGGESGSVLFEGDTVAMGSDTAPLLLTKVSEGDDAFEYGITVSPTEPWTAIYPNWCALPTPQFWIVNPYETGEDLPIYVAGNSVQVVYGEGILRLSKKYCTDPVGANSDYTQGLGLEEDYVPTIKGIVWRYLNVAAMYEQHPMPSREPLQVHRDVFEGAVSQAATGSVATGDNAFFLLEDLSVDESYMSFFDGDGTWPGTQYAHACNITLRLEESPFTVYKAQYVHLEVIEGVSYVRFELPDLGTETFPVGATVTIGTANEIRNVVYKMLQDSGLQIDSPTDFFYIVPPEMPKVKGVGQDVQIPPQVFNDVDGKTPVEVVAEFNQSGYAPPNWVMYDTQDGKVRVKSVEQQPLGHASVVPIAAITSGITQDRSDLAVSTRVIARGSVRQQQNIATLSTTAIDLMSGGLDESPASLFVSPYADSAAWGQRLDNADLTYLITQAGKTAVTWADCTPWMAQFTESWPNSGGWSALSSDRVQQYVRWARNKFMYKITFPEPVNIHSLELQVPVFYSNSGFSDRLKERQAQTMEVWYKVMDGGYKRALTPRIQCTGEGAEHYRIDVTQFTTRGLCYTDELYIRMCEPWVQVRSTKDEHYFYVWLGFWLSKVQVFTSPEVRGVAKLGSTDNWKPVGSSSPPELSGSAWTEVLERLRQRTFMVPDVVPWASDQYTADWLALEWLKDKIKNLAAVKFTCVRPDLELWDTLSFTLPNGYESTYLVTGVDHLSDGTCNVTCIDYAAQLIEV